VGNDMSILRVSCTYTFRASLSRSSEISLGDWSVWGETTSSLVLGCEGFAGFFGLVARACLGPTVGSDFSFLLFLVVFVTSLRIGISVTAPVRDWGSVGGAALTTRPLRTTWFQQGPSLSCSAVRSTRYAFGAAGSWMRRRPWRVQQASA